MYEFTCKWCGKKHIEKTSGKTEKLFCDMNCFKAYNNYRRDAKEQAMEKRRSTPKNSDTITPESQCQRCVYGLRLDGSWCCNYWKIMQCTRHSLHPEGLPGECQEYKPRRRRKGAAPLTVNKKR